MAFLLEGGFKAGLISESIRLEIRRLPVGFEGCLNFCRSGRGIVPGELDIPFKATRERCAREVGGTDIGRVKACFPIEDVGLGVKARPLRVIRDANRGILQTCYIIDGFAVGGSHIRCCDDAQPATALGERLKLGTKENVAAPFDERDQQINSVRTLDFLVELGLHGRFLIGRSGEERCFHKRAFGTGQVFPWGKRKGFFACDAKKLLAFCVDEGFVACVRSYTCSLRRAGSFSDKRNDLIGQRNLRSKAVRNCCFFAVF